MAMNFRTLDLNLLRLFDTLMSEGSLTRAAEVLAITQPAASHALKRLNEAVGEALFVRNAFGMTPTPRAEALWPQVRSALAALQQALAPGDFDPQTQAVTFRLAVTDATAAMLAPSLVAVIERELALCNLRFVPLTTHEPRRLIQQGDVDLALGHFPEAVTALLAAGRDATLRHARLYDTRYVCIMRRGHPLAERPLTLDAYCAAHHLLASATGRAQGYVDHALTALGRQRRVVMSVNQYFTAGQVVTQSDLLTVLPLALLPATGHEGELLVHELPFDLGAMQVSMLWHMRRDAEPAHRWLRQRVLGAAGVQP
jgi:DNA-binding transcriptional LysR family regulator